jgi:hypothetical protein
LGYYNLDVIALASNPFYHARTKYIEMDYHFIRENVLNKDISMHYWSTYDQLSNIFTNGLTSSRFLFLYNKLMVLDSPISLRRAVSKRTMIFFFFEKKLMTVINQIDKENCFIIITSQIQAAISSFQILSMTHLAVAILA